MSFAVVPIAEGESRRAIDSYGFYVMCDEDKVAGAAPQSSGPAYDVEEAFWAQRIVAYNEWRARRGPRKNGRGGGDGDDAELVHALRARDIACRRECSALVMKRVSKELRQRLRLYGGLPFPKLRRMVWAFYSGAGQRSVDERQRCAAEYQRLLALPVESETRDVIQRDLGRTFPTHCLFRDAASVGQTELQRVLHAYCAFDPEVGYCQGMGFIVATLLLHAPEEEAFWIFVQMMNGAQFNMRQLYRVGFPLLQQFFVILRQLCKKLLPHLARHMEEQSVDVAFFAAQWFMTLFAYQFPLDTVCRIWDHFFCEGWKFVFQVTIALLRWEQDRLLSMRMEDMLLQLKNVHENKSVEELIRRAMSVPIHERDLVVQE